MRMVRWLVAGVLAVVLAVVLVRAYQRGKLEHEGAVRRDEPVVAPSRVVEAQGEAIVVIDTADVASLALEFTAARRVASRPTVPLPGELVADSARVAQVRAPVAGRVAPAPGAPWPALGARVTAGSAVAQVADARPLEAPLSGVVTAVAARPGELVQAGQLLLAITDRAEPLARIAWQEGAPAEPPATLPVRALEGGDAVPARLVGPAPEADPETRRPAFLYRLARRWPGAIPGVAVVAEAPAGPVVPAVLVPASATVQWEGLVWAYVERGRGRFARVRIPTDRPEGAGWAVTAGIAPGDRLVTRGAEQILSEEFRAQVRVGDEVAE